MVHLHWSRVHNGEFGELRRSSRGRGARSLAARRSRRPADPGASRAAWPTRWCSGSTTARADPARSPPSRAASGFAWQPAYTGWTAETGWRYDLADDDAVAAPAGGHGTGSGAAAAADAGVRRLRRARRVPVLRVLQPRRAAGAAVGRSRRPPPWPTRCARTAAMRPRWTGTGCTTTRSHRGQPVGSEPARRLPRPGSARASSPSSKPCSPGPTGFSARTVTAHPGSPPALRSPPRWLAPSWTPPTGSSAPTPKTAVKGPAGGSVQTVGTFTPLSPRLNPHLISLYERVRDRLTVIRERDNHRRRRSAEDRDGRSFWGEDPIRDGWRTC